MSDDDVTLLRRYVDEGREEAFAQLVRRNLDMVYAIALRRVGGDAHLAQDVAQDVFIALARHAGALASHRRLAGWLFTATRNAAANRVRGEVRRRAREQAALTMQTTGLDQDPAGGEDLAPVLDESLEQLPERDRLALLLRFYGQKTFAEVGAALRLSEDGARMRVDRALGRLRVQLARQGVRSSAALLGTALAQQGVGAAPVGLAARAARVALATPVAPAVRLLDFLASFRTPELVVLGLALLITGGALALGSGGCGGAPAAPVPADVTGGVAATTGHEPIPPALIKSPVPSSRRVRLAGGRRTELAATYEPLHRALGLSAPQIERFETTLVPVSDSALWVFDHPAEIPPPSPDAAATADAELRALLGEAGYRQYREYNRSVPARQAVRQVAGAVYLTEPMSRERGEELTALLTAASRAYQAGGEVRLAELDWTGLMTAARPLLSPGQVAALEAVRLRVAWQEALRQRSAVNP